MEKHITAPITKEVAKTLKSGDYSTKEIDFSKNII